MSGFAICRASETRYIHNLNRCLILQYAEHLKALVDIEIKVSAKYLSDGLMSNIIQLLNSFVLTNYAFVMSFSLMFFFVRLSTK